MLPMTYTEWLERREGYSGAPDLMALFHLEAPEETIRLSVQWLLERLYRPDTEQGHSVTRVSLRRAGVLAAYEEPINWGDLSCVEVERFGEDGWLITIEEAAPRDCPALCAYIQGWLEAWGWGSVKVVTEW